MTRALQTCCNREQPTFETGTNPQALDGEREVRFRRFAAGFGAFNAGDNFRASRQGKVRGSPKLPQ
jgi:hypothetical protein